jgi:hypothetical protein
MGFRRRLDAAIAFACALVAAWQPVAFAADNHREAVLRLVSLGAALREQARAVEEKGMLGIDVQSRMAAPECAELLQDLVSTRNLQAVSAGDGELVVKWHGKRELVLRARGEPAFALEVHDKAGPACAVMSVRTRGHGAWQGKLTPMLLDVPGTKQGPAQVFVVDPLRAPAREPLR